MKLRHLLLLPLLAILGLGVCTGCFVPEPEFGPGHERGHEREHEREHERDHGHDHDHDHDHG